MAVWVEIAKCLRIVLQFSPRMPEAALAFRVWLSYYWDGTASPTFRKWKMSYRLLLTLLNLGSLWQSRPKCVHLSQLSFSDPIQRTCRDNKPHLLRVFREHWILDVMTHFWLSTWSTNNVFRTCWVSTALLFSRTRSFARHCHSCFLEMQHGGIACVVAPFVDELGEVFYVSGKAEVRGDVDGGDQVLWRKRPD